MPNASTPSQSSGSDTRQRVLDTARAMIQEQGYHAVSFRNLAAELGIKPASIHYYFPSKEDLVNAMVDGYRAQFTAGRAAIEANSATPGAALEKYTDVVRDAFNGSGRMCLCGVLAAELAALPDGVANHVRAFFEENEAWLAAQLRKGRKSGELTFAGSPARVAAGLFAALQGALMSAWTFQDGQRVTTVGRMLIQPLKVEA